MKKRILVSKKAQGLPMNTVIITILVILVLFVVAAFFLGGTSGLTKTIRGIFFDVNAGQDRTLAVQTCKQRCDQLSTMPADTITWGESAYCKSPFFIDEDNDGEAQKDTAGNYIKYYCDPAKTPHTLRVSCSAGGKTVVCP